MFGLLISTTRTPIHDSRSHYNRLFLTNVTLSITTPLPQLSGYACLPSLHYSDWRTLWQPFTAAELHSGPELLRNAEKYCTISVWIFKVIVSFKDSRVRSDDDRVLVLWLSTDGLSIKQRLGKFLYFALTHFLFLFFSFELSWRLLLCNQHVWSSGWRVSQLSEREVDGLKWVRLQLFAAPNLLPNPFLFSSHPTF